MVNEARVRFPDLKAVYMIPGQLSHRRKFIPVPFLSSVFV